MTEPEHYPASYVKALREESRRHRVERDEARREVSRLRAILQQIRLEADNSLNQSA